MVYTTHVENPKLNQNRLWGKALQAWCQLHQQLEVEGRRSLEVLREIQ